MVEKEEKFIINIYTLDLSEGPTVLNTSTLYGPQREKTCLQGFLNNKGADQPAHLHSLISDFVIRLLKSIISKLAT